MSPSVTKKKKPSQKEEHFLCLDEEMLIISDDADAEIELTTLNPINLFASPLIKEGT